MTFYRNYNSSINGLFNEKIPSQVFNCFKLREHLYGRRIYEMSEGDIYKMSGSDAKNMQDKYIENV